MLIPKRSPSVWSDGKNLSSDKGYSDQSGILVPLAARHSPTTYSSFVLIKFPFWELVQFLQRTWLEVIPLANERTALLLLWLYQSHPRSSTSHPERYTIGIYRSYRQLSEKLKSSIMGVPSVLSNPYVQSFLIEGSIRHVAFSSKQGSKSKNPPHSIENPCWIPQPVLFKMRFTKRSC